MGYTLAMALLALAYGGLGLIIGSFLNVLVIRHGARSLGGRSTCMRCGVQLTWRDMIPVLSWMMLSGKCRHCSARISIQYPLVEATTAIIFGFIGGSPLLGLLPKVLLCVIAALLVAIAAYDFRHTIIPDEWAYTFAALAFLSQFSMPSGEFSAWIVLAGPIAATPLFFLWLVSRGQWMGLGDAKLTLGIGWLLGPTLGITSVFFAFVVGALVSLPLVFFSSRRWGDLVRRFTPTTISQRLVGGFTMKSEIPFGPFLILSCIILWLCLLYDVDLSMYAVLFPLVAASL